MAAKLRYKVVFHYTNGSIATVRNLTNLALVEMSGDESHPADLLLIMDKELPTDNAFGDLRRIDRTIIGGENLCDNLNKIEVFTRPLTKRSRYTQDEAAVMVEMALINRINAAMRFEGSVTCDKLQYGSDRTSVSGLKHVPTTRFLD